MTTYQSMRTVVAVLGMAFLWLCIPVTAYGQSDRTDRPDSQDVSSPRKDSVRERPQDQKPPSEVTRQQTLKYGSAPRVGDLKAIQSLAIDGARSANEFQAAFDRAVTDHTRFLEKFSDTAYGNSHVKLRFDDFALAYFIVRNPQVSGKFSDGLQLAEKRAQLRSYKKILREDAGLDRENAERIEKEAKLILKSFSK